MKNIRIFGISVVVIVGVVLASGLVLAAMRASTSVNSVDAVIMATNVPASSVLESDAKTVKLLGEPPYALSYAQLFSSRDVRYGLTLSSYLKALDHQTITFEGYLTPSPIGLDLDFVFLTESPIGFCPCCVSTGDIPPDLMMVVYNGHKPPNTVSKVRATGHFEISTQVDEHTGFVSSFRMYADKFEVINDQTLSKAGQIGLAQYPPSSQN